MPGTFKKIHSDRAKSRLRRKATIRKKIVGTAERPRLSVFRSLKHVYVQAIDDTNNVVLAAASDLEKDLQESLRGLKKGARARKVGEAIGKKLVGKEVKSVVFDRNGYIYHGRVKEVADGAREAGLEF